MLVLSLSLATTDSVYGVLLSFFSQLSTQLAFLGLCLVLDVPVLYLWVTLASVALLPLLQLRRERLVRDLLRG